MKDMIDSEKLFKDLESEFGFSRNRPWSESFSGSGFQGDIEKSKVKSTSAGKRMRGMKFALSQLLK